jgi:hypothetical protein
MSNRSEQSGTQGAGVGLEAENHALREQLDAAHREVAQLRKQQESIARLVNCSNPAKLEHDIRNVLNELTLYKSLMADTDS